MKVSQLVALHREASEPSFSEQYKDLDIRKYAYGRMKGSPIHPSQDIYHALQVEYGMTEEECLTLFHPDHTFGKIKELYKSEGYNEVWLSYFPVWLTAQLVDESWFDEHYYWLLTPGHNAKHQHEYAEVMFGTEEEAVALLEMLLDTYPGLKGGKGLNFATLEEARTEKTRMMLEGILECTT